MSFAITRSNGDRWEVAAQRNGDGSVYLDLYRDTEVERIQTRFYFTVEEAESLSKYLAGESKRARKWRMREDA